MKKYVYIILVFLLYPIRRYLWKRGGWQEFEYKTLRGLCRTKNGIVEILAIKNLQKHNGVFKEFLCRLNPKKTIFRECINQDLKSRLLRKGFKVI